MAVSRQAIQQRLNRKTLPSAERLKDDERSAIHRHRSAHDYHGEQLTVNEIADRENASIAAIRARLRRTGSADAPFRTVSYCGRNVSLGEAARLAGVGVPAISNRIRRNGSADLGEVVGVSMVEVLESGLDAINVITEFRNSFELMRERLTSESRQSKES